MDVLGWIKQMIPADIYDKLLETTGLRLEEDSDDEGTFYLLKHEDGQTCGDSFDDLQSAVYYATVIYAGESD
jgi:hypothetical protein